MPLTFDKLEIPLGLGLQSDIDDKLLPVGKVPLLQNATWLRSGELVKRNGSAFLGGQYAAQTPGNMPPSWQLATHKGALVSLSKAGLRNIGVYSPGLNKWAASAGTNIEAVNAGVQSKLRGQVMPARGTVFRSNAVNSSARVTSVNVATNGTYALVCWIQSNDVALTAAAKAQILELSTGKTLFIHSDAVTYGSSSCRAAFVNSQLQLVVRDAANIEMVLWSISNLTAGNGQPSSVFTLATDATSDRFDVLANGNELLVIYAGATTRILRRDGAGVVTANNLTTSGGGAVSPGVFAWMRDWSGSGRFAAIVASGAQGVTVQWDINLGTGLPASSYTVDAGFGADVVQLAGHTITNNATGEFVVLYANNAGAGTQRILYGRRFGGSIGTATWIWSASLGSMTFSHESGFYVQVAYESDEQGTLFTVRVPSVSVTDATDGNRTPSAKAFAGLIGVRDTGAPPDVHTLSTHVFLGAAKISMRLVQLPSGTSLDSGVDTLTLTFNPANVNSPREFADSLYVCGGVLGAFDGVTFAEEGFHLYPEPPALSQVAGGSLSSPGNYSVLALYRYTDDFGRRRVSQASAPTEISLSGANRTIRAVIKTLKLHGRPGKAAIEVYCTTNNAPDDHRLVAAVANVETVDTVTVDITASDAQIALGQESPSDGDVLEPEPPPPALAVWPVKDRLAVIDATDPTRVLVSLPLSETEGPRFNSVSSFRVDDGRGDLIGGAAADDRSILFKRDAIYAVLGDGPDLQGNGTFGLAQLIAAGIGTVEPRSIVSTPDGVMFRSISNRSGIFMVNRGLAIDDQIGKPVQENLRGLSVVEAVHIPETLQTKFVTSAGQILVYDHVTKLWDVDVGACESATAYGGRMVRQQQGQVAMFMIAEDITGTVFDDSSGPVALYAETPWISIAKLKGYFRFKRVQLTGEKRIISDEDDPGYRVTLTLFKDFDDTPLATVARNMLVTDDINAVELRYSAKVSALKIGVTISQKEGGSVNFAGPKLTGLTVVYAVKEGLRKTASGNRLT